MKRVKDLDTSHRDAIKMSWSENKALITYSPLSKTTVRVKRPWVQLPRMIRHKTLQTMHHNEDLEVIENVLPRKEKFLCEIIP